MLWHLRILKKPHMGFFGLAGTLLGTGVSLGCCAPAFVASGLTLLSGVGLGFLEDPSIATPVLYLGIGGTLASLAAQAYRNRNGYPLLPGIAGAGILLFPFYQALDVTLFRILLAGGLILLLVASFWAVRTGKCHNRSLDRKGRYPGDEHSGQTETHVSRS